MKAKEIYNMWIGSKYNNSFEMYLFIDKQEYENKKLKITGKGKKYKDGEFYSLWLTKKETRWNSKREEIQCDIIREKDWFLNLRDRKYSIDYIDIYEQFKLEHFSFNDGKLIFMFSLVRDKIEFVEE